MTSHGTAVGNAYSISVDYGMSVEELVKLGHYDRRANENITSHNFPTRRKGKAEVVVELIRFDRYISIDEALSELDKMGFLPTELHELLAFSEKYPDLQREFPVIALGSSWQYSGGYLDIPYLGGNGSERYLDLRWFGISWGGVDRFAVVRKPR